MIQLTMRPNDYGRKELYSTSFQNEIMAGYSRQKSRDGNLQLETKTTVPLAAYFLYLHSCKQL